jgi:hypothetical protein
MTALLRDLLVTQVVLDVPRAHQCGAEGSVQFYIVLLVRPGVLRGFIQADVVLVQGFEY